MTDRELLEKAAKAAGMKTRPFATNSVTLWHERGPQDMIAWNPLTDDGDALRLAVNLDLTVRVGNVSTPSFGGVDVGLLRKKQDPHAATRRAIVLAAAMIGRSIP